jgi:ethanolamine phosphate phosphodiesterase
MPIGRCKNDLLYLSLSSSSFSYLAKTFALANAYVRPDWTLFLGDIFDEGLSASDDEFKRYFDRFDTIFGYESHEQRMIVIPGDNDVGGEYYGDKQPILRQRFRNYFGRTIAVYRQNDIEFLKVIDRYSQWHVPDDF